MDTVENNYPTMEELLCSNPANSREEAAQAISEKGSLLTFDGAKADLEHSSVQALLDMLNGEISPRDRLAAVKETTEILGYKQKALPNLITGQNVQVNQITSPEVGSHLLNSAKQMQDIAIADVIDIKTAEGGRG